ncbi:hypothetical protein M9Y10_034386 [Tritrichomonas musculus]|uniref:Endoplasmic reticulum-Golgi intermediate compartment protein 3 n=1 Tax=Tritrichomonas musculus TaxID=1915356 RepID=A0ABR2KES0_9EUKA
MSSFFESIDLFDKVPQREDFTKETKYGHRLSITLFYIGSFLVIFEIIHYFVPDYIRELSIKQTNRNENKLVNISLSILVNLPCFFLHLDSIDSLGYNQLNINTTASFIRITREGREINRTKYFLEDVCQPCHGLLPEGYCCNSCEKLMTISNYFHKTPTPEKWPQCNKSQGDSIKKKAEMKANIGSPSEKCLVKGKISVNKVPGSFHIAPGRNVKSLPGHVHDTNFQFPHFDLSHSIHRLRFGPKVPRASNPLDDVNIHQLVNIPVFYKYTMIVTPIKFYKNGKFITKSFEYTSMAARYPVTFLRAGMVPGIFFSYSFTPYTITVKGTSPSLLHAVASTTGMLSGMYAIASLLDEFFSKMEAKQSNREDEGEIEKTAEDQKEQ